jgi:hypothetical protein
MSQTTRPELVDFPVETNGEPKGVTFWQLVTGRFKLSPLQSNGVAPEGLPFRNLITGKFRIVPNKPNGVAPKPAVKEKPGSRPDSRKPLTWGIIIMLIGLALLLTAIVLEQKLPIRELISGHASSESHLQFWATLGLQLMSHLGIAALILGAVGITVDFKHWTEYFEKRLASTIREKEFLKTLKEHELDALLRDVFLSRFKVEQFEANSFLNFFTTKIQKYIGSSFRENVNRTMTIGREDGGYCPVTLDVHYKCRRIAGESSTIQETVVFEIDEADIQETPKVYKVTLTIPHDRREGFSNPLGFPPCKDGKIVVTKEDFKKDEENNKCKVKVPDGEGKKYSFQVSLLDFGNMDGLHIHQHAEYFIPAGKFNFWAMAYPSKGVQVVFMYPDDEFEIKVETSGMDPSDTQPPNKPPGLYTLNYDSWVLPECGVAYGFFKKSEAGDPGNGDAAKQNLANEAQTREAEEQKRRADEAAREKNREPEAVVEAQIRTSKPGSNGELSSQVEKVAADLERSITEIWGVRQNAI